jgi:hypothetical protein
MVEPGPAMRLAAIRRCVGVESRGCAGDYPGQDHPPHAAPYPGAHGGAGKAELDQLSDAGEPLLAGEESLDRVLHGLSLAPAHAVVVGLRCNLWTL